MKDAKDGYTSDRAALKTSYELRFAEIEDRARQVHKRIWAIIEPNRSRLIKPGKQSFTTIVASFQFRRSAATLKVVKGKEPAILRVARRLRVVKKFASPPSREYQLDPAKFLSWLPRNIKHWDRFAPFVDVVPESESLSIQPNETHVVVLDKQRKTPPSVGIKKS